MVSTLWCLSSAVLLSFFIFFSFLFLFPLTSYTFALSRTRLLWNRERRDVLSRPNLASFLYTVSFVRRHAHLFSLSLPLFLPLSLLLPLSSLLLSFSFISTGRTAALIREHERSRLTDPFRWGEAHRSFFIFTNEARHPRAIYHKTKENGGPAFLM